MRLFRFFVWLLLGMAVHAGAQAQNKDFSEFLGKLKVYVEKHQLNDTWSMPVWTPDSGRFTMPSPDLDAFMEDPETGLQFFPASGKIFDPETGYTFNRRTGTISRGKRPDG